MGCTGVPMAFGGGSFEIGRDPVADVKKLYEFIETGRGAMGKESHIQNEIDELCTIVSSALYKLTRLA